MKRPGFVVFAGALFLILSCASENPYRQADVHAERGEYEKSLAIIERDKKNLYRDKDAVLYYLDAGLLSHYTTDYRQSTELLQEGERAIEAAYTKSITMEISTYLINDTAQEYAGEDYEDIYINAFNALNYYHEDDLEDAMVEIRRMNNKLAFLASKYGIIVDNMQKQALSEGTKIPADPSAGETTFSNSALARYLGMLFYRGNGNLDDARIDRDQIHIAFANNPSVYSYPPPSSLNDELPVPAGKARFNIIAFSGSAPIKEEAVVRILIPNSRYIKIALPVMTPRPSAVNRIEVRFDSGQSLNLELLEDIGAIATETFKERAHLAYLKSVLRATIKGVASSVLDRVGDEVEGAAGTVLGLLSIGTQIFAEASEQADLRISRYFPAKAYVGGITLDPGVYSYSIIYYSGGQVVDAFRQENVAIRPGGVNLAEAACLK